MVAFLIGRHAFPDNESNPPTSLAAENYCYAPRYLDGTRIQHYAKECGLTKNAYEFKKTADDEHFKTIEEYLRKYCQAREQNFSYKDVEEYDNCQPYITK